MKISLFKSGISVFMALLGITNCSNSVTESPYLKLEKTIILPNVGGRIDHMSINVKEQLVYIACLGNNTVEVVDLKNGSVVHSITGLHEPQGVVYIPGSNAILVANGDGGLCDVFDAANYQLLHTIQLADDADNVRYDSVPNLVLVGNGQGFITFIDAKTFQKSDELAFKGHPEAFQISNADGDTFVNVPDNNCIYVFNSRLKKHVNQWRLKESGNFPMALDEQDRRLFIVCRSPSKFEVLSSDSGNMIASIDCTSDADDVYYNAAKKEVYVTGGMGYLDVFKQTDADNYKLIAHQSTRLRARTSLFIPELNKLLIALPAFLGKDAQLNIYDTH